MKKPSQSPTFRRVLIHVHASGLNALSFCLRYHRRGACFLLLNPSAPCRIQKTRAELFPFPPSSFRWSLQRVRSFYKTAGKRISQVKQIFNLFLNPAQQIFHPRTSFCCIDKSSILVAILSAKCLLCVTAINPIFLFRASSRTTLQICAWVMTSSIVLISSQIR